MYIILLYDTTFYFQMKLLNLYIKRAQSQMDSESATTSKTTSPITDQV